MSFIDQRFPTAILLGGTRREIEDVEIVTTVGGFENRNIATAQGVFEYEIEIAAGDYEASVIDAVHALWKASRGGLYGFRLRDWDPKNRELTAENIGTGDGSATAFQISKSWTVDGQTQSRRVTRPVAGLQVFKAGVLQVSGVTVNYDTGVVTFSTAPTLGQAITVTGEFDIPVRFDAPFEAAGIGKALEDVAMIRLKEIRE